MQNKDCNFFKDQIYDYMADALDDERAKELLLHIESCPECKREFDAVQSIISASASLPQIEVPDGLKTSIFEKLGANNQGIAPKRYKFKRFASVALPAAACIALSIGVFSGGLYDKFTASDSIVSSGDVNPAGVQTNTEPADATENTDTSANATPDNPIETTTPKKATPQPKAEQSGKNVGSSQNDSIADTSSSLSEDMAIASDTAETESSATDTPSVASAYTTRERTIDSQGIDAEQATNDSFTVAEGGGAKAKIQVPASCIVITENIAAFSNEFGVTAEDGELHFELDADKWQDFLIFAENTGAELNADYSAENNACVSITIRWKNK